MRRRAESYHIISPLVCYRLRISYKGGSTMDLHKKFADRIRRKEAEIAKLKGELASAEAYLQALNDSVKMLPRDASDDTSAPTIRPNSLVGRALELLKTAGVPMHVNEILTELGLPIENRNSVASQLSAYTRRGDTFERTAPNTFGLRAWGSASPHEPEDANGDVDAEPPSGFGAIN